MRIAISGNSGFIGQHLTEFLSAGGDVVVPLKHAMFRSRSDEKLKQALTGCDVVINEQPYLYYQAAGIYHQ